MNTTEQTGERRKPNRRERDRAVAIDALRHLAELWPGLFAVDPRRPLKIGIRYDIMAALGPSSPFAPYMVGAALRLHCGSPAYLKSCRDGAARFDLDGQPVGVVTTDEAEHARMRTKPLRKREKADAGAATPPAPKPTVAPSPPPAAPSRRRLSLPRRSK